MFAGTLVVRERIPVARAPGLAAPEPWLAQQLNGVDLSSVPDSLWLAVRQCLGRARQLDAQVAAGMAGRLAEELALRTGVPVPAGVPAASYLAAVAYERRERERRKVRFRAAGPVPCRSREMSGRESFLRRAAGAERAVPVGRRGPGSCPRCEGFSQVSR